MRLTGENEVLEDKKKLHFSFACQNPHIGWGLNRFRSRSY